ncbi:MAG TPA: prepilin-type N-terminal cleavage/methylation domain-containing protein [bacterium]|nr:prepilin-type N-terminal cleavage/methylation domain-containing protein [bacterium]
MIAQHHKHHYSAFTLVELLVVIAIIGILSTLSVVVFNNVRAKARDSRRLSDVKQIGMALELYYDDTGRYPPPPTPTGTPITGLCLSNSGFTSTCGTIPYLQKIPSDPLPNIHYTYSYLNSGESYRLGFNLEQGSGDWPAGTLAMGPNGISQDLLAASGIDWRDPSNWKNYPDSGLCGATYDQDRKAIKIVNRGDCLLAPAPPGYIPIDTSRKYYIEAEYLTVETTTYVFTLGTKSYDASYNPVPAHAGGADYFGANGDRPTSTNTWTFVVNKQISGQPRTGESADTSKFDKWHPGTFWAKVVVIPNCCTGPQTTYIRNVRFYVE